MPLVPPIYLTDPTNQAWQLIASNAGVMEWVSVTGVPALSFVLISDVGSGQAYRVVIDSAPTVGLIADPGPATVSTLLVNSPDGTLYGLQWNFGRQQTVAVSASDIPQPPFNTSCPFALGDALNALGLRLYDPNSQFWSNAEKTVYLQEALRTWQAMTGYWRADFLFPLQSGVTWYDLTNVASVPNSLRRLTQTDASLLQTIEYHLLEPTTSAYPITWAGSQQFSLTDILGALQRRQDEILGTSSCTVTYRTVPAIPGRLGLPGTMIDIRRMAFLPAPGQGQPSVMWQTDIWSQQYFQSGFTTNPPGKPKKYTVSTEPFLTVDIDPQPNVPGQYEILGIESAQSAFSTTAPTTLTIPDDWAWVAKWGAMADLFSRESNAKDGLRARYCEERYKQGLQIMMSAPAVLAARLNNIPMRIDAVKNADQYKTRWQSQVPGKPKSVYVGGLNILAMSPAPDTQTYSVQMTVVMNAPVPVNLSDCVLVTRDVFDVILDYAQHLASVKMGGEEFLATIPLYQRFLKLAAQYVDKLEQQGEFQKMIYDLSQREMDLNPVYAEDVDE